MKHNKIKYDVIIGGGHNGLLATALNGAMPQRLPLEMYCHTLSDPSIYHPLR